MAPFSMQSLLCLRPVAILALASLFFAACGPETAPERRQGRGMAEAKSLDDDRLGGGDGGETGDSSGQTTKNEDGGSKADDGDADENGDDSDEGKEKSDSGTGNSTDDDGSNDKDGDGGDSRDDDDDDGASSDDDEGSEPLTLKKGSEGKSKRTDLTLTTKKYDKGGRIKVQLAGEDDDDAKWKTVELPRTGSTTLKGICFNGNVDTEIRIVFESDYKNTRVKPGSKDMRLRSDDGSSLTIQIEQGGCAIEGLCSGPDDDEFILSCPKGDLVVEDLND